MEQSLGHRIALERKNAGLTQKELAQKIGVPYQTVQFWEHGKRNPKFENIQKIAAALGVSWLDLMPKEALNANTIEDFAKDNGELAQELVQQLPKETARLMQQLHDAAFPRHGEITDPDIQKVSDIMQTMNDTGRRVAVERVQELAQIPAYQQQPDPDKK